MKKTLVKMLMLSSIASAALYAGEAPDYRYSVTPMIGGEHAISKQYLKNGTSYGARLGYNLDLEQSLELGYDFLSGVDYKNLPGKDTDVHQLSLNYLYTIAKYKVVQPYFLAGLGYEDFSDNYGKLDDGGIGNVGVGLKYFVTKTIPLRFEVRDIIRFDDGGHTLAYTAGVSIPFGKVAKEAPKPADSDNDGVIDTLDKCPNTPAGTEVDASGCPLDSDHDGVADSLDKCPNTPEGAKVDANGCALDSDHDGVIDLNDKCPNTPEGVKVDSNGCPLDSDNDGVIDSLDKCPNTPKGFKVDKNGCAVGFTMHINFATDSAAIPSSDMPKVEKLAKFLIEHPQSKVILKGYTDNVGSAAYNLKLSKMRADSVAKALIKEGVEPSRIEAKGFGESNPIASNDTPEGRAQNRRVEAVIVPTQK